MRRYRSLMRAKALAPKPKPELSGWAVFGFMSMCATAPAVFMGLVSLNQHGSEWIDRTLRRVFSP